MMARKSFCRGILAAVPLLRLLTTRCRRSSRRGRPTPQSRRAAAHSTQGARQVWFTVLRKVLAALAFGHAAPDAELDPVVERVGGALLDDGTVSADCSGFPLCGAVSIPG